MNVSTNCLPSSAQSGLTVPATFQNILSGKDAFYNNDDNYLRSTYRDFVKNGDFSLRYRCASPSCETQSKIVRLSKKIFFIATLGVYKLCHIMAGILIIPASFYSNTDLTKFRLAIADNLLKNIWKYKRISVELADYKIDGMILGKASALTNGRWILASNGNAESYERKLCESNEFYQLLAQCNSNALVFNYPGVGASSGHPTREAIAKSYRAMLTFLEDKNGIGAKEIIGYGFSLGAGIQGDALTTHQLQENISYVFVKDRTFSNLSAVASLLIGKIGSIAIKILGWNIDITESSKKLQAPEIILQTANVEEGHRELQDSSKISDDGVILTEVSLAKELLDDSTIPRREKIFIGIKEKHCENLKDVTFLTDNINSLLQRQKSFLVFEERR